MIDGIFRCPFRVIRCSFVCETYLAKHMIWNNNSSLNENKLLLINDMYYQITVDKTARKLRKEYKKKKGHCFGTEFKTQKCDMIRRSEITISELIF
jgi:hypothetical protein